MRATYASYSLEVGTLVCAEASSSKVKKPVFSLVSISSHTVCGQPVWLEIKPAWIGF